MQRPSPEICLKPIATRSIRFAGVGVRNLWYVRQVVGYVLRAKGMGLRNWLVLGLALCVLTIAFSLFMYPALSSRWVWEVAVGFLFCGYAAVFHTRPVTPEDAVVLGLGTRY
jgi:hypothetical protein